MILQPKFQVAAERIIKRRVWGKFLWGFFLRFLETLSYQMPSKLFWFGFRAKNQKIKEVYQQSDKPTKFYDFFSRNFKLQQNEIINQRVDLNKAFLGNLLGKVRCVNTTSRLSFLRQTSDDNPISRLTY